MPQCCGKPHRSTRPEHEENARVHSNQPASKGSKKKQFDWFWRFCYIQGVNGNLNLLLLSALLLCRAAVGL
jgi:hypothetical protein